MSMKPPIVSAATLVVLSAGLLPAADPGLLNLVMPDAKILAGVNVDQAKASPFGVYVLGQIQAQGAPHLQQVTGLTGFDPTRDLHELLVASNAVPGQKTGLILARGNFDATHIQAAGLAGGGTTLVYKGVTLLLDPKQVNAVAFLDPTLAVAGDVASVEAAIDRQTAPAPLPAATVVQVNQWSGSEDAWVVANVPFSSLKPPANASTTANAAVQNAFQNIQQAAGGVKFGAQVAYTGQALADTPQDATSVASVAQFLASMAQLQAQNKNPQLAAVLTSLSVTTNGNVVNVSLSVPEAQAEQAFKAGPPPAPQSMHRVPRRRQ